MTTTPNAETPAIDPTPIGTVRIGKTTYVVRRLPVGPSAADAGIRNQFSLEGPRGAMFLIVDHGPRYRLNAIAFSRSAAYPMRGVERGQFAAFGVEA